MVLTLSMTILPKKWLTNNSPISSCQANFLTFLTEGVRSSLFVLDEGAVFILLEGDPQLLLRVLRVLRLFTTKLETAETMEGVA